MILQVHEPGWQMAAPAVVQSRGLGCGGDCGCKGCSQKAGVGMRGIFDDLGADPLGMIGGFLTESYGPLPMWAWIAGAGIAWYWLFMPSGREYREKRRRLRSEYTGYSRISRRAKKVGRGAREAFL